MNSKIFKNIYLKTMSKPKQRQIQRKTFINRINIGGSLSNVTLSASILRQLAKNNTFHVRRKNREYENNIQ